MRIRKSPWGRYGSRRWPAWDTLETSAWVPVRCSFRRGADPRARRADPFKPRSGSGPGHPVEVGSPSHWRAKAHLG